MLSKGLGSAKLSRAEGVSNLALRIAVDLDGVLANTMLAFCRILNKRYSTQFAVDSFIEWDVWQIARITKDEFFRTLDEAWFEWKSIPPIQENLGEMTRRIQEFGAVDIVTARSPETVEPAKAWLKQHGIRYDTFVSAPSTMSKAKLSYNVFIDDSPDLMSAVSSSGDRFGILYTQPWNRDAPSMPRILRVDNWGKIPEILSQIQR